MQPNTPEGVYAKYVVEGEPDACWIWKGRIGDKGYGTVDVRGQCLRAHRLSWSIHRGAIPDGQVVRHSCDFRACVNPSHLLLGSQLDNIEDRQERGRQARGEQTGSAKLSVENVREIRRLHADGLGQREVARKMALPYSCVHGVISGKWWAHVDNYAPDASRARAPSMSEAKAREVIEALRAGTPRSAVRERFGLGKALVDAIAARKCWRSVWAATERSPTS